MRLHHSSQCKYHPDRAGVGICVRCGIVICTECTTRFEGINHCASCVAALDKPAVRSRPRVGPVVTWVQVAVLLAVSGLGAYGLLHMILLW